MNKLTVTLICLLQIKQILTYDLLISHKSLHPFTPDLNQGSQKNYLRDYNNLKNYPPMMCNIIFNFREKLIPYEIFTNKFRKYKNLNYFDRGIETLKDQFDYNDITQGIQARGSLFELWQLENLKSNYLYEESEDDKLFEFMEFPEDGEEEDDTIIQFKRNKRSIDWGLFGSYLAKLMFVYDFNDENDHFYCLRNIEVSHLIFKLIYFGYLPGKRAVRDFLRSFLEGFFNVTPNKDTKKTQYIKEVYYQLFRSFYSLHLQWFVKLDSSFIAVITKIYDQLHKKKIQNFLIENFISLYLMVIKTLDFAYSKQIYPQSTKEQVQRLFKDLTIRSGIFALSFAIGYLKTLCLDFSNENIDFNYNGYKLNDLINLTGIQNHDMDIKSMIKDLINDNNEFDKLFFMKLRDLKFIINTTDVLRIYERIKVNEEKPFECEMCEANLNFNDYYVFRNFREDFNDNEFII